MSNPYRAEAENIRAKLMATTCSKQQRVLRVRLEFYETEAVKFDERFNNEHQ